MNPKSIILLLIFSLTFIVSFYMILNSKENFWIPISAGLIISFIVLFRIHILPMFFLLTSISTSILFSLFLYNSLGPSFYSDLFFIIGLIISTILNIVGYRIVVLYTKYKTWLIILSQTLFNITLLPLIAGGKDYSLIIFSLMQITSYVISIAIAILTFKKYKSNSTPHTHKISWMKPLPMKSLSETLHFKNISLNKISENMASAYSELKPMFIIYSKKPINVSKGSLSIDGKNLAEDILKIIKNIQIYVPETFSFKHIPLNIILISSDENQDSYTIEFKEKSLQERSPHQIIVTGNINKVL